MNLTGEQVTIIKAFKNLHNDLAMGDEPMRRELTQLIGEQFCFLYGDKWGNKSTDSNSPRGKDGLAYNGPPLEVWDWQNGTTREVQVTEGQPGSPIPNQHFIPCQPINHLGIEKPGDGNGHTEPTDPTVSQKLDKVIQQNEQILMGQERIAGLLQEATNGVNTLRQTVLNQEWVLNNRVFGEFTLKAKK